MAKRGPKQKQLQLIETLPENIQEIVDLAEEYEDVKQGRLNILDKEKELKHKLLEMIKASGIKPLEDGVIRFRHDGFMISITPRDELIKVKEIDED